MGVNPAIAINAIKNTYNAGKKALEIADALKNVELKEAILELKEENLSLREENISLKEQLSERQKYNMVFKDNCYWNIKDNGLKEGPFCSACWDDKQKAVRMLQGKNNPSHFECPICKNGTRINYRG